MKFILGKKLGMSQVFDKDGKVVPLTLIEAGPCYVVQLVPFQIGFEKLKAKKIAKPQKDRPFRYLKEFPANAPEYKLQDQIDVSVFQEGDRVKISGTSKGKGFQGGVRRWGFSGRPSTRGAKHEERTLGAVGAGGVQKVIKGKKMPGHMGAERVTVRNLKIVKIDKENNILAVKGAVPGPKGTLLEIRG